MNKLEAKEISKKIRAFEHCEKVLTCVEKRGSAIVKLNCTGITFTVERGDALHLEFVAKHAALWRDIQSYRIVQEAAAGTPARTLPAPSGASGAVDPKIEARRAYQREYYARKRKGMNPAPDGDDV